MPSKCNINDRLKLLCTEIRSLCMVVISVNKHLHNFMKRGIMNEDDNNFHHTLPLPLTTILRAYL